MTIIRRKQFQTGEEYTLRQHSDIDIMIYNIGRTTAAPVFRASRVPGRALIDD
jgi:hypothetical protein